MSEWKVEVIRLGKVGKHPNADSLSITNVLGNYCCIFRTGDFQEGDKAVFVPFDSVVPLEDERWSFLNGKNRIKPCRLRGIFSLGVLTKAEPSWEVGRDVREELRITKYEPPLPPAVGGQNEHCPFDFREYTDIEGLRKFPNAIPLGTEVVFLEKIHGTNGRWVYRDGRLWAGSHHCVKKQEGNPVWWKIAEQYNLEEKLKNHPNLIMFGEVYGWVQDLKYGVVKQGEIKLAVFDIFNMNTWSYLNFWETVDFLGEIDLPMVPVISLGFWQGYDTHIALGEGQSLVDPSCIREGFVVRPVIEQWHPEVGRLILKYAGEQYLLRKGG